MSSYRLGMDVPKDNVFVTQLSERESEWPPVEIEPEGQRIEQSLTTRQHTHRLRAEVEYERMESELEMKREEFEKRMKICEERKADIQRRQQRMRDRVAKFEKFINENEVKRRRAIQKFQLEVRLKEQKRQEQIANETQLKTLKKRCDTLKGKLARSKKYEDYLLKVLDILPEDYLDVTDTKLNSLMMRHKTLSDTNATLMENINSIADDVEKLKQNLKGLEQEHERMKLAINRQLSENQTMHERKLNENHGLEEKLGRQKLQSRSQAVAYGQILMAIDNLAEKARRSIDPAVDTMKLTNRLQTIEDYITHQMEIISMAMHPASVSPSSARHSR